ncbi:hypothetical protein ACOMHN_008908 [Nucella lapillus]
MANTLKTGATKMTTTMTTITTTPASSSESDTSSSSSSLPSTARNSSSLGTTTATSGSQISTDNEAFPFAAVAGISAAGGVILFIIIFVIVIISIRRHRRINAPPPLPKLDEYGLISQDSTLRPGVRYQPWVTSEPSPLPHNDPNPDPEVGLNQDPPFPVPVVAAGRESVNDHGLYVNMDPSRLGSGTGIYITCSSSRPESVPPTIAPGFDGKLPYTHTPITESLYMPMDLGSTTPGAEALDDGIYVVPGEAELETVYCNPDQPPLPCFSSSRMAYVNVPSSDPHGQQSSEGEQGGGKKEGEYQNLSPVGHIYNNIFQDVNGQKTKTILRSESLGNMVTPTAVCETLQGCQSPREHPSPVSGKNCGVGSTPHKTCSNLHKAKSMSQVPFSSSPKLASRPPGKWPLTSLGDLPQELDSGSEGENYENLKNDNIHYINAPDKKVESSAKSSRGNGFPSGIPALVGNKQGHVGKKPDKGNSQARRTNSKPGADSKIPGTVSNKPGTVGNKTGTVGNKPGTVGNKLLAPSDKPGAAGNKPGTVSAKPAVASAKPKFASAKPAASSQKPGTVIPKPGMVNSKAATVSAKPGTVSSKPGTVSSKPGNVSTKPGTVSAKPGTVSAKPGTSSSKPGTVSAKPGTSSSKPGTFGSNPGTVSAKPGTVKMDPMSLSKQKPEKEGKGCSNELMDIFAKRRQNNGDS